MNNLLVLVAAWCLYPPVYCDNMLNRQLQNLGSHRDLFTTFHIPSEDLQLPSPNVECSLLFTETIPSGAFVDPYQLAGLKQHNGPDFFLKDTIDLEQPEFMSEAFQLLIYSNLSKVGDRFNSQYNLPVHIRYHAISSHMDHAVVSFPHPKVAIRCVDKDINMDYHAYKGKSTRDFKELCSSTSKWLCEWTQLQFQSDTADLQMKMPVGKAEHFYLVTIGTILTTVLGCVYLVYVTIRVSVKHKPD